jgi:hypothetical protein
MNDDGDSEYTSLLYASQQSSELNHERCNIPHPTFIKKMNQGEKHTVNHDAFSSCKAPGFYQQPANQRRG